MADENAELRQNLLDLIRAVAQMQDHVVALMFYLNEEPTFDRPRYLAHLDRARKNQPYQPEKDRALSQRLQAFLRDFEGPKQ